MPGFFYGHWSGLEFETRREGIQVLAAAYLALNQDGEGSSPSDPTEVQSQAGKPDLRMVGLESLTD